MFEFYGYTFLFQFQQKVLLRISYHINIQHTFFQFIIWKHFINKWLDLIYAICNNILIITIYINGYDLFGIPLNSPSHGKFSWVHGELLSPKFFLLLWRLCRCVIIIQILKLVLDRFCELNRKILKNSICIFRGIRYVLKCKSCL